MLKPLKKIYIKLCHLAGVDEEYDIPTKGIVVDPEDTVAGIEEVIKKTNL